MSTVTGLFLLSLIGYSTSATNTRCFPLYGGGSLCFTQPDPPVALSWSRAMEWCKNIGATLPTPDIDYHNTVYGNAVGFFGLRSEILWLAANSTFDLNNWYWLNGTIFTGPIINRNIPGKTHAYILRNGTNISIVAASPFEYKSCIRQYQYSEIMCANIRSSYWSDGKCYMYMKDIYTCSWYQCAPTTIDHLDDFTRWLGDLEKFWIGLRCTWWSWQDIVTGTSRDVTERRFEGNLPNGSSEECLASYRNNNDEVKWINLNCSRNLQFICQQYVNVTTTAAATTTTTATKLTTKTTTASTTTSTSTTSATPTTRTSTVSTTTSTTSATPTTRTSTVSTTTSTTNMTPTTTTSTASTATSTTNITPTTSNSTVPTTTSTTLMTPTTTTSTASTATSTTAATLTIRTRRGRRTSRRTSTTSTTTAPSYSLGSASYGDPPTSSTQNVNIIYLPKNDSKSLSIDYGLVFALGVGLGGGLLLVAIAWLTLLTICACRKLRETKHSLMNLERQVAGNPKTTASNSYDSKAFKDSSEMSERQRTDIVYEAVEHQANERI